MNKVLTTSEFSTRPKGVNAIQILTVFKLALALGMFVVFSLKDITIGSVGPQIILYTWFGYLALAAGIFAMIRRKHLWGLRIALLIDFAISIPSTAVIGLVISGISFGLTFMPGVISWFRG